MWKPNDSKMDERRARLLRPWLEKRNYSPDVFWKLVPDYRKLLYKTVCLHVQLSDQQRRDLFNALHAAEAAEARAPQYADPLGHWTPEQLRDFFSSETSDETETRQRLSKY
ncbi:MAG: hypothetical protein KAX23_04790 [Dehalococcoidia bacterium]|nr:hypothetical protein [Dehalococcoidia bacterium]